MKESVFYICSHCGNIIEKVEDHGVPVVCCGQKMNKLVPGVVEASHEKHVPVIERKANAVTVTVGSVEHPMSEEHSILWVSLTTNRGVQRVYLNPGEAPSVRFSLVDGEEPIEVFAYCNLHGLWKTDI